MIKQFLIKFHTWLGNKLGIIHTCPVQEPHTCPPLPTNILVISTDIFKILPAISILIEEQETFENVSGEWKRHQVYAKAIKHYPDMQESELALAIEIGIQKLKGDNYGK